MMNHKNIAARLSQHQREMLIRHVDGDAKVHVAIVLSEHHSTRLALIEKGLIKLPNDSHAARPTHTEITVDGRHVLCCVLAEYAEALVRAGYGVNEPDEESLAMRWKGSRAPRVTKIA